MFTALFLQNIYKIFSVRAILQEMDRIMFFFALLWCACASGAVDQPDMTLSEGGASQFLWCERAPVMISEPQVLSITAVDKGCKTKRFRLALPKDKSQLPYTIGFQCDENDYPVSTGNIFVTTKVTTEGARVDVNQKKTVLRYSSEQNLRLPRHIDTGAEVRRVLVQEIFCRGRTTSMVPLHSYATSEKFIEESFFSSLPGAGLHTALPRTADGREVFLRMEVSPQGWVCTFEESREEG